MRRYFRDRTSASLTAKQTKTVLGAAATLADERLRHGFLLRLASRLRRAHLSSVSNERLDVMVRAAMAEAAA